MNEASYSPLSEQEAYALIVVAQHPSVTAFEEKYGSLPCYVLIDLARATSVYIDIEYPNHKEDRSTLIDLADGYIVEKIDMIEKVFVVKTAPESGEKLG